MNIYALVVIFIVSGYIPCLGHHTVVNQKLVEGLDPILRLPFIDNEALAAIEYENRNQGALASFAHPFEVNVTPFTHGEWSEIDAHKRQWTLQIVSAQAHSLNFGFSEFILPESAKFYIYNNKKEKLGPFTANDNEAHYRLYTPILEGASATLVLEVDAKQQALVRLRLQAVNHAFMPILSANSNTADCYLDVNCGIWDGWEEVEAYRKVIRSVGAITIDGVHICSGVLINNTARDRRPYLLTAAHCNINAANAASIVVYWNYQNSTCREMGSEENGTMGDGIKTVSNTGAHFRALYNPTDVVLLELDDPVNPFANAYFAGWDRQLNLPEYTACIHHPNGGEKRISFDRDVPDLSFHFGMTNGAGDHYRINNWEIGSTAGGSSGAPLFNENQQIIGQLHGGDAACDYPEGSDWFGAFWGSWEGDGEVQTSLKSWLDPLQTNELSIDGMEATAFQSLLAKATVHKDISCLGGADGRIGVQVLGGLFPYQYSIDAGENYQEAPIFDNISSGEYSILVKDAADNTIYTNTVTLNDPTPIILSPEITINDVLINVMGGTPPYTYKMEEGAFQESNIFKVFERGVYAFSVMDVHGCIQAIEVLVTWEDFSANAHVETPSCFGDRDASISLEALGGVAPYFVRWYEDGLFHTDSLQLQNLPAGIYQPLIVDSVLDSIFFDITIIEPPLLNVDLVAMDNGFTIVAEGGTLPYLYSIDDGNSFQDDPIFNDLAAGMYAAIVQDANGCEVVSDSIEIISTSIAHYLPSIKILLSPNPTHDILQIQISGMNSYDLTELEILNIEGKPIWKQKMDFTSILSKKLEINVSNYKKGIYLVRLGDSDNQVVRKFIKV